MDHPRKHTSTSLWGWECFGYGRDQLREVLRRNQHQPTGSIQSEGFLVPGFSRRVGVVESMGRKLQTYRKSVSGLQECITCVIAPVGCIHLQRASTEHHYVTVPKTLYVVWIEKRRYPTRPSLPETDGKFGRRRDNARSGKVYSDAVLAVEIAVSK